MPAALASFGPFQVPWTDYIPDLGSAVVRTLEFTLLGFLGAAVLGLFFAVLRLAPLTPARVVARIYTETFKNLPLITEIFIIYYGLGSIGIRLDTLTAGALSLAIFYGAYLSEIFRGGLQGVPKGQREAAQAVGFSPAKGFWLVAIPQATRLALPGTTTMVVDLLKGTSLMVAIGAGELMTEGQIIVSNTFAALEVYVVIGLIYLAMCYPLSHLALMLERRLRSGMPLSFRRRRLHRIARQLQLERAGPVIS